MRLIVSCALIFSGCDADKPADGNRDGTGAFQQAKIDTARNQAKQLEQAAAMRQINEGSCPKELAALEEGGYVQRVEPDPWGRPFRITCAKDGARVRSAGPDGKFGTDDDVGAPDSEAP